MSFDHASMGDAFARPGMDPRQWCSYATVLEETDDQKSVYFKDENGTALPDGPLVAIELQPSGIRVLARVAGGVAGNGEADWVPFIQGDQVIALVPQGSENAGVVIVGRLNSKFDPWPQVVAGQDPTKNTFAFRRLITPYIVETAASYLLRSAVTGAQIGIDATGQVLISTGDKHHIILGADVLSFETGDGETRFQMQVDKKAIILAASQSRIELMSTGKSSLLSAGALAIGASGTNGQKGHAVTAEQVVTMFLNYTCIMAAQAAWSPTFLPLFASGFVASLTAIVAGLAAGATPAPVGPTPGGNLAAIGGLAPFTAALASPIPTLDPTGFIPGIGIPGVTLGG